ncbi:hypothetical protein ACXYN8_11615 [Altererythrobacter sp. CAU 1778]
MRAFSQNIDDPDFAVRHPSCAWVAMALALVCAFVVQTPDLVLERATPNLDFWVHYNYAREYVAAIEAGEWRPRWAYDAHQGLGEPGLLYYSPLYYYAVWAANLALGSVWHAMQWVEIAGGAMLGWFVWRLCSDWGLGRLSLVAIPIATFTPNLVLLHHGFNGYPWATSGGALAYFFWSIMRPLAFDRRVVDPVAIVALALVICSHTVSGLMAVIMVGATGLPAFLRAPVACWRLPDIWKSVLTIVGGLALSSWYLLPAFGSLNLIEAAVWRENFLPYDAFSLPIFSAVAHGIRWFGFQWPASLASFALSVAGLALVWRNTVAGSRPLWLMPTIAIVAVTFFLSTELSYPLWTFDTPLRSVQFPHRFITLLEPIAPFIAVSAIARLKHQKSLQMISISAFAVASVALGSALIVKSAVLDGEPLEKQLGALAPYPGLDEYRTAAAAERGYRSDDFDWSAHCAARQASCSKIGRLNGAIHFRVESPQAVSLAFPLFHFPSWTAKVNEKQAPLRPQDETGLVELDLPAGRNLVTISWTSLPLEKVGAWLSLATILLLLGTSYLLSRRNITAIPREYRTG